MLLLLSLMPLLLPIPPLLLLLTPLLLPLPLYPAVVIAEPYLTAASYTGAECKYTESFGIDTNLVLGGGAQSFTFRSSTQVGLGLRYQSPLQQWDINLHGDAELR
jgi:hypothetical protein